MERTAQLRQALTKVVGALSPAFADAKKALEPVIEALFCGEEVSGTFLQLAVGGALESYWQAALLAPADGELLARLSELYSLALDDPTRVPSLDVVAPRELTPPLLIATVAPPLKYVLDDGAVALRFDPDPLPELGTKDTDTDDTEAEEVEPDEAAKAAFFSGEEPPESTAREPAGALADSVSMAPSPVSMAPSPVSMAPSPVSMAPSPASVAPSLVSMAPSPVSMAPSPVGMEGPPPSVMYGPPSGPPPSELWGPSSGPPPSMMDDPLSSILYGPPSGSPPSELYGPMSGSPPSELYGPMSGPPPSELYGPMSGPPPSELWGPPSGPPPVDAAKTTSENPKEAPKDPTAGWEMDEGAKEPVLLYRYYRDYAYGALEDLSLIARHRRERRFVESPDEEEWMVQLCDAIANIGQQSLVAARRHFMEQLEDGEPSDLWGSVFFASSVEGLGAARLVDELASLLKGDIETTRTVADAVALGTNPELVALLRDWAASPQEVKRALSVAVGCRRQEVDAERASRVLADPSRLVRLLAFEGLRDLEAVTEGFGEALRKPLRAQWCSRDPEVVWQAVLTASWLGLGDAYRAWRRGDPLFLEEREFEMIVTMGEGADLPRVRTLLEVAGLTPRTVRLLGRFGHPGVIPVLLHGLKDEELQEHAALALEMILGPKLDSDARIVPEAWAGVIAQTEIPREGRMWFGEPHQPTTFAREVERGRLSLVDLEELLEELRIRTGCIGSTSLHGWHAANTARFDQLTVELGRANDRCQKGSWSCALSLVT